MISATDRKLAVELINEAVESGARLFKACEELGISKRTYNRWKDNGYVDKRTTCERPEPKNKLSKTEKENILEVINSKEFSSKAPNEIVPILADRGEYLASESTMYKILKEAKQLAHRGNTNAPLRRPISTHKATAPNQVWTWDITYLKGPIKGTFYYLYLISDLYSRKIVGWEIWEKESAEYASQLIQKACREEKIQINKQPLVLHSDNGSPMKGATMLETLYALGIVPSRSRPRVSNDNPYAESLFKTLKYRPNYQPKGFKDISEARLWVLQFVKWYNTEHKHSGIKFVSPEERHLGLDKEILENRKKVYTQAKEKHPERWTRETRNWDLEEQVWLNPEKETNEDQKAKAS